MERVNCGGDSEVNSTSNDYISKFSFSFWRMEDNVWDVCDDGGSGTGSSFS